MVQIECVVQSGNRIGECPLWNVAEQALYWLDTRTPLVRCYRPGDGRLEEFCVPAPLDRGDQIVSFGFRRDGGMIAAFRRGFYRLDIRSATAHKIVDAERVPEVPEANRLNDGKCDARGRYWCGSMDTNYTAPSGSLYRLGADHVCTRVDGGIICANGIAFSPDQRTLYLADTRGFTIWAWDFDLDDGVASNRRVFVSTRDFPGRPDGATVDTDGNYWIALVAQGAVACFSPAGRLLRMIELPVQYPTMCSFGGADLDLLFVTSAAAPLTAEQQQAQPLAGALFAITGTGAQGLPEPLYAG
jgi:L-arabinonolactonase